MSESDGVSSLLICRNDGKLLLPDNRVREENAKKKRCP